jgi:hypothetical protein
VLQRLEEWLRVYGQGVVRDQAEAPAFLPPGPRRKCEPKGTRYNLPRLRTYRDRDRGRDCNRNSNGCRQYAVTGHDYCKSKDCFIMPRRYSRANCNAILQLRLWEKAKIMNCVTETSLHPCYKYTILSVTNEHPC